MFILSLIHILTDGQQVVHAVGSQIVQIGLPIVLDARVAGDELIAPAGLDGAQVGGLLSVDVGLLSGERYEGLDGQRAVGIAPGVDERLLRLGVQFELSVSILYARKARSSIHAQRSAGFIGLVVGNNIEVVLLAINDLVGLAFDAPVEQVVAFLGEEVIQILQQAGDIFARGGNGYAVGLNIAAGRAGQIVAADPRHGRVVHAQTVGLAILHDGAEHAGVVAVQTYTCLLYTSRCV